MCKISLKHAGVEHEITLRVIGFQAPAGELWGLNLFVTIWCLNKTLPMGSAVA